MGCLCLARPQPQHSGRRGGTLNPLLGLHRTPAPVCLGEQPCQAYGPCFPLDGRAVPASFAPTTSREHGHAPESRLQWGRRGFKPPPWLHKTTSWACLRMEGAAPIRLPPTTQADSGGRGHISAGGSQVEVGREGFLNPVWPWTPAGVHLGGAATARLLPLPGPTPPASLLTQGGGGSMAGPQPRAHTLRQGGREGGLNPLPLHLSVPTLGWGVTTSTALHLNKRENPSRAALSSPK